MIINPYILPVTSQPNQVFKTVIPMDDRNVQLTIQLSFREVAGYWTMDITDKEGNTLLTNLPLLKGQVPAANLLGQFGYLGLGYLMVLEVNPTGNEYPNSTQLGTDFILVWGGNDE